MLPQITRSSHLYSLTSWLTLLTITSAFALLAPKALTVHPVCQPDYCPTTSWASTIPLRTVKVANEQEKIP